MKNLLLIIILQLTGMTLAFAQPSPPTGLSTTSIDLNSSPPKFTANWGGGGTSWLLDVSTSSSFAGFIFKDRFVGSTSELVTVTGSFSPPFYWRVRAVNGSGTSGYSLTQSVYPSPSAPNNLAATDIQETVFTATWSAPSFVESYRLDVATTPDFTVYVPDFQDRVFTSSPRQVTGLTPGSRYYMRIRSVNSTATSSSSAAVIVDTPLNNPVAPATQAATSITTTSFQANWGSVATASGYKLYVSTSPSMSGFLPNYGGISAGTGHLVTGLTPDVVHYYAVKAYNAAGDSPFSDIRTVAPLPPAPSVQDATGISAQSFTANWSSVLIATSYKLYVSLQPDFSNHLTNYNGANSTPNSLLVTGLVPGSTYYYRVKALNATGGSDYSNYKAVTTSVTEPDPPTAQAATSITSSQFQANWSAVSFAPRYKLYVSLSASMSGFIPNYGGVTVEGSTSALVTGLMSTNVYYYAVRANNAAGDSPFSNIITVYPFPPAPATLDATSIGETSFVANWNSLQVAQSYKLDVSINNFSSFVGPYHDYPISGGSTTSQLVEGLTPGWTYQFRVRAVNSTGTSDPSNTKTVATLLLPPSAPEALDPSNLGESSFNANWTPSSQSGVTYKLFVSTVSMSSVPTATGLTGTTYQVANIFPNTIYYYRVKAVNAAGESDYSNEKAYYPVPPTPQNFQLTNVSETFSVSWNSVLAATSYDVLVARDAGFTDVVAGYGPKNITNTNALVSGLEGSTHYYVKVRSVNPRGSSGYSSYIDVLTVPSKPELGLPTEITATSFKANWSSVPGATMYNVELSRYASFTPTIENALAFSSSFGQIFTGLDPSTLYYYRVRGVNSSGASPDPLAFRTVLTLPPTPVLSQTTNVTQTGFMINWAAITGVSRFVVQISDRDDFETAEATEVTATSMQVVGKTAGKLYFFRVRSKNDTGLSEFSEPGMIYTTQGEEQNFVETTTIQIAGANYIDQLSIGEKLESTEIIDGLGRPVQNVVTQGSPSRKDVVQPIAYDLYNREPIKYLPYTNGTNGKFKSDFVSATSGSYSSSPQYSFYQGATNVAHDQKPYAVTVFEPSPLNRPAKQGAPGIPWQPNSSITDVSDRSIKTMYRWNMENEVICFKWNTATEQLTLLPTESQRYYVAGRLSAVMVVDEHQNDVIEFKDKLGRVVCKKVLASPGPPLVYASTYYVYDDFGDLVLVIPPEGVQRIIEILNQQQP